MCVYVCFAKIVPVRAMESLLSDCRAQPILCKVMYFLLNYKNIVQKMLLYLSLETFRTAIQK